MHPSRVVSTTELAPVSRPSRAFPWQLVGLLFCCYLVAFIDRGLVSVAAAPIKQDLALSDVQLGLLLGPAFVVFFCLCGIPLGWWADRTSRRGVLVLGMLLWSLMTALCGVAGSFKSFLAARLGVGLGEACLVPAGVSLIAQATPHRHVAKALGIFLMGATFGNAAALLVGGHLLDAITFGTGALRSLARWRVLFLLAALPGPLLAAAVVALREPQRAIAPEPLWPSLKRVFQSLGRSKASYGYLSVATTCFVGLAQVPAIWMPLYCVRAFGISAGTSAFLVGLIYLATAPTGQWLGSVLLDRLRSAGVIAAPHLLQAVCAVACLPAAAIFCTSQYLGWCEAAFAAYNLVVFAATPAGLTGWRLLTPEKTMGLTIAILMSAVTFVSIGFGAAVVGGVTDFLFRSESALGSSLLVVITLGAIMGFSSALVGRAPFEQDVR
jgi:MFS family permease